MYFAVNGPGGSQAKITMALAAYRIPGSSKVTLVKGNVLRFNPGSTNSAGFYIRLFSTSETFCVEPGEIVHAESFSALPQNWFNACYLRPAQAVGENTIEDYYETLNEAIAATADGRFQKLVIARNQKLIYSGLNHVHILDKLGKAFPECLVYVFSTPHTGTWMGATPEKLLVKKQQGVFQTMALAGTIKSETKVEPAQWGQKEREEQQFVEAYIEEVICKNGYAFEKTPVYTLRTGILNHLCTGFDIRVSSDKMLELAGALHPTPAVAGLPAAEAVHFIRSNEKYLRECYTGYLGPVGIDGQELLYVNLRCCQLVDEGAFFYAGGGINKGSVADKEIAEVENKIKNLQRFFIRA